jgi:tRNA pseudouridine32 synthase/23S rRNA pseudouridine746 synthase
MPSFSLESLFFPLSNTSTARPKRFTFPFYYQPHELAITASKELQDTLLNNPRWQALFQLSDSGELLDMEAPSRGKMFGVLVVQDPKGELGYLRGFSGKIDDNNHHKGFVPPVYDMLDEESFFADEMTTLNALHAELKNLEQNTKLPELLALKTRLEQQAKQEVSQKQAQMVITRANRKQQRADAQHKSTPAEKEAITKALSQQSIAEKRSLATLKAHWNTQTSELQQQIDQLQLELTTAKQRRADQSNRLQHKLFAQYSFLDGLGKRQDLNQIFARTAYKVPPAGAGECAAPKLLQYAYLNDLKPIALAEFWWGHSPKSEIRHHMQYYPSCMSKCHPILGHMLQGIEVDPDPLENNLAEDKSVEVLYQDEHIIVIHKPEGMLSVPGRKITDSAKTRVEALCSGAEKVFVLHRLDMATSGILVFALSQRANKHLQKQFITREVKKRYVALIRGAPLNASGSINLPLCGDPYDLPRQMVCEEQGKPALTHYETLENLETQTKVSLIPETGRTHQLRVHCAHKQGLNAPIVGDALYGTKAERLYLHAQQLAFTHPITQEWVTFEREGDF